MASQRNEDMERSFRNITYMVTPFTLRQLERAREIGAWLTTQPCTLNGLIYQRHQEIASEWHHLCSSALTPIAVSDKPVIKTGRDNAASTTTTEMAPQLRGDVAARGFWCRNRRTIFDVRVTDTDNNTQRNRKVERVLLTHEKEKKKKYLSVCLETRQDFKPLCLFRGWPQRKGDGSSKQTLRPHPLQKVEQNVLTSMWVRAIPTLHRQHKVGEYVPPRLQKPYPHQIPVHLGQWSRIGALQLTKHNPGPKRTHTTRTKLKNTKTVSGKREKLKV